MEQLSADQVREQVQRFWQAFTTKQKAQFGAMYLPSATVFAADARRSEPARLMIVRRSRELLGGSSSVEAKLGFIEVQLLGPKVAVASYPLRFTTVRIMPNGRRYRSEVPNLRATHVFVREPDGSLRIIHEHLSSAEQVAAQELDKE